MSYNLVQADGSLKNIAGGSGGDASIELTQAEYDALKEAGELKADTTYFVKDAESGDGNSIINDVVISEDSTWSSSKINANLGELWKYTLLGSSNTISSTTIAVNNINQYRAIYTLLYNVNDSTKLDTQIFPTDIYKMSGGTRNSYYDANKGEWIRGVTEWKKNGTIEGRVTISGYAIAIYGIK